MLPSRSQCPSQCQSEVHLTADRYSHQISGGQQQRVALARALAIKQQALLLDEPLSALDAKVRATLRDEIRRIQTELGITTLFVTHDQEEALAISDRVGVMWNGHLEQLGEPTDVYRHPSSAFVARFVGSMNELAAVVRGPDAGAVGGYVVATPAVGQRGVGEAVLFLVRPEDMALGNGETTGMPGTVTARTFQGAATIVGVRLDVSDALVAVHSSGSAAAHLSRVILSTWSSTAPAGSANQSSLTERLDKDPRHHVAIPTPWPNHLSSSNQPQRPRPSPSSWATRSTCAPRSAMSPTCRARVYRSMLTTVSSRHTS